MTPDQIIREVERILRRDLSEDEKNYIRSRIGFASDEPAQLADEIKRRKLEGTIGASTSSGTEPYKPDIPGTPGSGRSSQGGITNRFPTSVESGRELQDLIDRYREAGQNAGLGDSEIESNLQVALAGLQGDQLQPGIVDYVKTQIEAQIETWNRVAEAAAPKPIGVPEGYQAIGQRPGGVTQNLIDFQQRQATRTTATPARYFEGDELNPSGMNGQIIIRLQQQLIAAGLLEEDEVWMGTWDPASQQAYKTVLGLANAAGKTADEMVVQLAASLPQSIKDQRAKREELHSFHPDPYLKPDKATLRQKVQDLFRSEVGRDPRPGELTQYVAQLEADDRASYEVQTAMAREAFYAANPDAAPQPPTLNISGDSATRVPQTTFQGIDPLARFQQAATAHLKPETDRLAAISDMQRNRNNVMASLSTLGSLIR